MMDPVLVGVDWGTTNARAYLLDPNGGIVAQSTGSAPGIMGVADGDFAGAFAHLLASLPVSVPARLPIVLSGMITSRQGWVETGYVDCPAGLDAVAAAAQTRDEQGRALIFAPGLTCRDAAGTADVMRGEELQILGALAVGSKAEIFCLPGTHSKWAWVESGRIRHFRTAMTGEIFGALSDHTILGRLMGGRTHDADAFALGVDRAGAGGYVLHDIFSVRTEGLFGRLSPDALSSYLSGLLIGHEAHAMAGMLAPGAEVCVIGGAPLAERYAGVLAGSGYTAICRDDPVVTLGQLGLARAMGVIG